MEPYPFLRSFFIPRIMSISSMSTFSVSKQSPFEGPVDRIWNQFWSQLEVVQFAQLVTRNFSENMSMVWKSALRELATWHRPQSIFGKPAKKEGKNCSRLYVVGIRGIRSTCNTTKYHDSHYAWDVLHMPSVLSIYSARLTECWREEVRVRLRHE